MLIINNQVIMLILKKMMIWLILKKIMIWLILKMIMILLIIKKKIALLIIKELIIWLIIKICVVYIQKTNLYDKTINISKHRNFIEIFDFFLLINNIILLYCNINGLYIKGLINNFDNKESLSEFISKKIELINYALLINSICEYVNILIILFSIYYNIYWL